jgi:hypothetical protein
MKILLFLGGMVCGLVGLFVYGTSGSAENVLQQQVVYLDRIAGLLWILIGVVGIGCGGVIEAVELLGGRLQKKGA